MNSINQSADSDVNKGLNKRDVLTVKVAKTDFCFGVGFEHHVECFAQAISHMSACTIKNKDEANCSYS